MAKQKNQECLVVCKFVQWLKSTSFADQNIFSDYKDKLEHKLQKIIVTLGFVLV